MQMTRKLRQIIDFDRADDIDDGELARLAGNQGKPLGHVILYQYVHVHILALIAVANLHELSPAGPVQLVSDTIDIGIGVDVVGRELVAAYLYALDAGEKLFRRYAVLVLVVDEGSGHVQKPRTQADVDGFRGLAVEGLEIRQLEPRILRRGRHRDQQAGQDDFQHSHLHRRF